jgi:hypothetical protein
MPVIILKTQKVTCPVIFPVNPLRAAREALLLRAVPEALPLKAVQGALLRTSRMETEVPAVPLAELPEEAARISITQRLLRLLPEILRAARPTPAPLQTKALL